MTRPTLQLPSDISGGLSTIITIEHPDTSVPSISPDATVNTRAALQKSFVAGVVMFDQVHGQIAVHEQFS